MRNLKPYRVRRQFNVYGMRFQRWLGHKLPGQLVRGAADDMPNAGTVAFQRAANMDLVLRRAVDVLTKTWLAMHKREIAESEIDEHAPEPTRA